MSLAACGSPSTDGPRCSDVWVEGHTLPKHYQGCDGADADPLRVTTCGTETSGRFVEFGGFDAVAGHTIHKGQARHRLREFLEDCA